MVPSGATVGEAPLPIASAPGGGTLAVTNGVLPGCSPKSKVQRTVPSFSSALAGAATAYSLPFMLERYTVLPSGESAGAALSAGPVLAVHFTAPSAGARANSLPAPLTTYTVPSG